MREYRVQIAAITLSPATHPRPPRGERETIVYEMIMAGVVRGREAACNSRSSLRLARWQLQNVPVAPPPPPTAIISARQRGCNSPLFSRGGGRSGRRDVMIDRRVHFHSLLYRNFKIFLLFLLLVSASLLWNGLRMDREDWSSAVQAYFVIYIT